MEGETAIGPRKVIPKSFLFQQKKKVRGKIIYEYQRKPNVAKGGKKAELHQDTLVRKTWVL